ncbi:MAG: M28 family peptidase [Flavobacteriales bacterium]|nr:M28 family peptidase [Flavobacteriales bacterium]
MRKILSLLFALPLAAQAQHPVVESILDALSIDSMMHYVEQLSGETPVDIGNGPELIVSRHKFAPGNIIAEQWLALKLAGFGYEPIEQSFSTTGRNILAWKEGTTHPDEYYILCAHFDAMPGGMLAAPAADDDGSGCGAVLEAARVLRDIEFEYSILFAFWDEEEQGLVGSAFHAAGLAANDAPLRGVVNMDAIAYDGNGDTKARIHTRPIAQSFQLSDMVFTVRADYDIDLDLILTNPGATYSDHASFWNEGYSAILVIEEFGADGNPYYHTINDKVEHFDVPYYEKLAKLSIATLATLAVPVGGPQYVADVAGPAAALYAFPNPTEGDATLWLELPEATRVDLVLLDAMGREVARPHAGQLPAGKHSFTLPLGGLSAGTYQIVARAGQQAPMALRLLRVPN